MAHKGTHGRCCRPMRNSLLDALVVGDEQHAGLEVEAKETATSLGERPKRRGRRSRMPLTVASRPPRRWTVADLHLGQSGEEVTMVTTGGPPSLSSTSDPSRHHLPERQEGNGRGEGCGGCI
jgi:hypothetical protein